MLMRGFRRLLCLGALAAAPALASAQQIGTPQPAPAFLPANPSPAFDPAANGPPVNTAPHTRPGRTPWSVGAGIELVRPFYQGNAAFTTTTGLGSPNQSVATREFDWAYRPALNFWVGFGDPIGWGGRVRFFYFNNDSRPSLSGLDVTQAADTTILPPVGVSAQPGIPPRSLTSPGILLQGGQGTDQLRATSDLRWQAIDFEATYSTEIGCTTIQFSGGARYLQAAQNYFLVLDNQAANAAENSTLYSGHNFQGAGPTIAINAQTCLFRSALSAYGSIRGSLLAGAGKDSVIFHEVITDPVNGNQDNISRRGGPVRVGVPAMDLELGLERSILTRRSLWFARAGVVNHTLFGFGNASSRGGDLSLFGVQFSAGVNY